MMLHDRIAALRARIAKAESARNAWRASGSQAKYVQAYCVAETLEQQLEQLRQEGLRASRKNSARGASASRSTPVKPRD